MTGDLGDPQVFRSAFNDHHRAVYAAAFRIVGDAALGELSTYLRLMARSRALDLWRESQVRGRAAERLKLVGGAEEEPRAEEHPGMIVERREDDAEVRKALGKLPEAQREAIVLAYWGGLTADQIARRAHVPLGTAKSRLRLGLARLRDEFAVAV